MTRRCKVVAIGGHLQGPSGAGLIHERLGSGLSYAVLPDWTPGPVTPLLDAAPSLWSRFTATVPTADAIVWSSTPLPLKWPKGTALFPIIYDLRWVRRQSFHERGYRCLDLARTLRRAQAVLTISETVASQLALLTKKDIAVLPLGPGQFEGFQPPKPENSRTIVLLGDAPHKRNELAAALLVESSLVRDHFKIVGVRISDNCSAILQRGMPTGSYARHGTVSTELLAEILAQASVYVSLSRDEGFGFPYVEAAYFGCDVIAPNLPITREVIHPKSPTLVNHPHSVGDLERALELWNEGRILILQREATELRWNRASRALCEHIARHV